MPTDAITEQTQMDKINRALNNLDCKIRKTIGSDIGKYGPYIVVNSADTIIYYRIYDLEKCLIDAERIQLGEGDYKEGVSREGQQKRIQVDGIDEEIKILQANKAQLEKEIVELQSAVPHIRQMPKGK